VSFNEECPTQYLGPEEGVTVTNALGVPVRVTKDAYFRMTERGVLTDQQMLNAKWDDGLSLQNLLDEANGVKVISLDDLSVDPVYEDLFVHRAGCASSRGRDCTCEYLAQWDRNYGAECVQAFDEYAVKVLNNPEHRWVTGDQLPPRETGR
jgi:hypothetical protein